MDELPQNIGQKLEKDYVRSTYDQIAEEFSSTRFKKWPKVDAFLKSLEDKSLLLDIGCGNGKYLGNQSTLNIGCDSSLGLLQICRSRGFEVVQCDMTRLPFRENIFDALICIAALHHLVGSERRQKCLEDMTQLMSTASSRFLVQVWAYEQNFEADNPYLKERPERTGQTSLQKELHIEDAVKLPIHENRTPFRDQDLLVPFQMKNHNHGETVRCLRYYHVFKEKELDLMIESIPGLTILDSYYDKGNWCSVITRVNEK